MTNPTLYVCGNRRIGAGSCAASGALELMAALRSEIKAQNLTWDVRQSPCLGHCPHGPNLKAAPKGPLLHGCTDAKTVIAQLRRDWRKG